MPGADSPPRLAVVGLGPRGLGALEALAAQRPAGAAPLPVDVFDPFPAPGAGPNFDPDESPVCWLNIPLRDIDIRPPGLTGRDDFGDWLGADADPDAFPPRAALGHYLEDRFADLDRLDALAITLHKTVVDRLAPDGGGWRLRAAGAWHGPYAEVLLTLGQPATAPDPQLAEWQDHVETSRGILAPAYPAHRLEEQAAGWAGKTVAIRGLALSAFDVLRALTTAQGGRFDGGRYHASGREPATIVPFSLDGLPPYPKPATEALDARFALTEAETDVFAEAIATAAAADPDTARGHIAAALVPPVVRILAACGIPGGETAVRDWLDREWTEPGTQETGGPVDILRSGIALAEGGCPPTIGYVIGQVWRKWQDPLRAGYNAAPTPPETAALLVGFDEGVKRYSYGPPVASSRELLALVDAGIVDLDLATDPEIVPIDGGWRLRKGDATREAGVMIDAVLPSPELGAVRADLVEQLVAEGRLTALGEKLAARTAADGQLISETGAVTPGLCLLGRLALGSVIAADSLHDCFGAAAHRWARGALARSFAP